MKCVHCNVKLNSVNECPKCGMKYPTRFVDYITLVTNHPGSLSERWNWTPPPPRR